MRVKGHKDFFIVDFIGQKVFVINISFTDDDKPFKFGIVIFYMKIQTLVYYILKFLRGEIIAGGNGIADVQ